MRDWIVHITAAAVLSAMALALTPKGRVQQVTRLACGLMCALAVAGPAATLDIDSLAPAIARYEQQAREVTGQAREEEKMLERTYIEEQCEAYIWGKADERGVSLDGVDLTARWDEETMLWYPWEVTLDTAYDGRLSASIEAELGIPAERQRWRDDS